MTEQALQVRYNLLNNINLDTLFSIFGILSLTLGILLFVIWASFGPGSTKLFDPFEGNSN